MNKRRKLVFVGLHVALMFMQPAPPGNVLAVGSSYDNQDASSAGRTTGLPATQPQGLYAPHPEHIWNRLYRHFYVRSVRDGQQYGHDEIDPLLWQQTSYLLEGQSYQLAKNLLDEFLSTHAERLINDPLKRAMLHRDVWAVFDWVSARNDNHQAQRRELQVRLARVIKRLALTREQINALPDNYALATAAKAYATEYMPERREVPFLPPDIFRPDGPWVCISNNRGGPVAPTHAQFFGGRSTFLVFVRLPEGRQATNTYLKRLRDFQQPWIVNTNRSLESDPLLPNPELPQFPAGTQLALIRQLTLIDDRGNLTPTPLTESVQLRVYHSIPGGVSVNVAEARASQDVYKFVLSRAKLFAAEDGGLRPVAKEEKEFPLFMSQGIDWFELRSGDEAVEKFQSVVLNSCASCHASPGVHSMLSYSRRRFAAQNIFPPEPREASLPDEASNTAYWKSRQYEWGLLQGLWHSDAVQRAETRNGGN